MLGDFLSRTNPADKTKLELAQRASALALQLMYAGEFGCESNHQCPDEDNRSDGALRTALSDFARAAAVELNPMQGLNSKCVTAPWTLRVATAAGADACAATVTEQRGNTDMARHCVIVELQRYHPGYLEASLSKMGHDALVKLFDVALADVRGKDKQGEPENAHVGMGICAIL